MVSSTCAIFSCLSIPNEWRKFPPKTNESTGVYTAWIHPVGMKNVFPSVSVILAHFSTVSPKKMSDCLPDNTHFSYRVRLCSLGGINQNTLPPVKIKPTNFQIESIRQAYYLSKCGTTQTYHQNPHGNLCNIP